ncbi:hypothetical protein TNCV_254571 [Trichonephila clavipes]|nr:hypothetical protein TNCV_254571 [Trichonephila clavipes]
MGPSGLRNDRICQGLGRTPDGKEKLKKIIQDSSFSLLYFTIPFVRGYILKGEINKPLLEDFVAIADIMFEMKVSHHNLEGITRVKRRNKKVMGTEFPGYCSAEHFNAAGTSS